MDANKSAKATPIEGVASNDKESSEISGEAVKSTPAEGGASHQKDSSVVPGDSTKAQNDVRDPSNPQTEEKNAEAARNVDDSGKGPNKLDTNAPGPRPLEQVAREHGGDAGNKEKTKVDTDGADGADKKDDEDDDGPQTTSHGEGTGELYVKSSGLKADGGDFDASNPGAGKEADRLLEQKGIHHTVGVPGPDKSVSSDSVNSGTPSEQKEKKSLGQKIKAKLHRSSAS